ncbi:hypothetical protein GCM10022252_76450 [Streptosporangium oxazolinicum]|uniref:Uncharacterized protein n=1 Tax=Streptosporangium oxazolinicum TaxID=909287 RepID=A0ABP8BL76_9ACTN
MTGQNPMAVFVAARLDEDEWVARESRRTGPAPGDHELYVLDDDHRHNQIVISGPRALAEVEAKRRTLARHPGATASSECPGCAAHLDGTWVTPAGATCPQLADLAAPYADHPGYATLTTGQTGDPR